MVKRAMRPYTFRARLLMGLLIFVLLNDVIKIFAGR